MAEIDLVLTDIDLDDATVIEFMYAFRSGAPVSWADRSWRVMDHHHTIETGARHTFELVELRPTELP